MNWLWGGLWFGLAVSACLVVKRAGWPSVNEAVAEAVANATAERFAESFGNAYSDEEKVTLMSMQRDYARCAIGTYVAMLRKWW